MKQAALILMILLLTVAAGAQDTLSPRHALALKLRTPLPDQVVVPLENVLEFNTGDWKGTRNTFKIEPIIPISLYNKSARLTIRPIIPAVFESPGGEGQGGKSGVGDINLNFFLGPSYLVNGWTWGIGPVVNLPTATDDLFGWRKWTLGPNIAIARQKSGRTFSLLLFHQWSLGGSGPNEISITTIDPRWSRVWKNGFTIEAECDGLYDWYAAEWTLPLRAGLGQVLFLGELPIGLTLDGLWYVARNANDPHWGISLTLSFIIKKTRQ